MGCCAVALTGLLDSVEVKSKMYTEKMLEIAWEEEEEMKRKKEGKEKEDLWEQTESIHT